MSIELIINRKYFDDCTISRVKHTVFNYICMMLELPDLDNKVNVSCIPEGLYTVIKRYSPSKKMVVLEYQDVPERTFIQIHLGNFTSQIKGCQLPGYGIKDINKDGILDVTESEAAFNKLMSILPEKFEVLICS